MDQHLGFNIFCKQDIKEKFLKHPFTLLLAFSSQCGEFGPLSFIKQDPNPQRRERVQDQQHVKAAGVEKRATLERDGVKGQNTLR